MPKSFKRALVFSGLLHIGLIVLIAASPSLSRPSRKGFVQYVNFIGGSGGGGTPGGPGGGPAAGAKVVAESPKPPAPPPAKRETLRDLTVPQKAPAESQSTMRYPVDKPKKTAAKKAAITKTPPSTAAEPGTEAAAGQQGGTGYGLRFGTGGGGGGTGTGGGSGSGSGDPFGLAGFPFSYYLQIISDRITANWFTSLVDTGVGGQYQTQVYFRIYKNGQISDLKVDISSGVQAFDLSALRAIQSSSPFPPLPSEYDGQYLGITLIFEHVK
jgi:TonB family protein